MTCFEAREYLFAFLDGELDAPLSIELQRHLEHCPECAREAEIERSIRRQLGTVLNPQDATAPQDALARVMAQIRSAEGRARRSVWRRFPLHVRLLGLAAAVLLLAVGGWFALRGGPRPEANQSFADLLVADFQHFLEAGKSLQLQSSDPKEASTWLLERTHVAAALPVMQHDRCKLVGARSCKVSGRPAAFAFYEIGGEPASFVALAGSDADLHEMQMVSEGGRTHWVDRCRGHTIVACITDGIVRAAVGRMSEQELLSLLGMAHEG
ncbi:MAG: zf-HC2 domain-containing protein [Planctomycetes bacterium]|nr:zf-HC2 domain-containing protein [Planctomycetota bacterium]